MEQTISEIHSVQEQTSNGHKADVAPESSQAVGVEKPQGGAASSNGNGAGPASAHRPQAPEDKYANEIRRLRQTGEQLRSDHDQPSLSVKPDWFDATQFENAKSVYTRHFMGVNFAHLSGLLLLVRINSIYRTLSSTGRSDSVAKLFRRYYQTVVHVKKWYEGDIFEDGSEANRSLLIVRGMHNRVCAMLNDGKPRDSAEVGTHVIGGSQAADESAKLVGGDNQVVGSRDRKGQGVHISEYDIMITQFAFVGFIVTRAKSVGLIDDFSQHDLESMLHFWRVIGHYLGARDEYNLCSRPLEDVRGLCEAILEVEFKRSIRENPISSPPGVMGINIVRSVKFIPMLTIYGITKYLYELLDLDTSEFEQRATRYSRLSYTLIKLVMTNLLAYRPFRWFNNGLTRLSVVLVGKIEDCFANRLESKYGSELRH